MLSPSAIEPQILLLASSALRPQVIALAASSVQVRKCGYWFRKRQVTPNHPPHGELHMHKMHEAYAARRQERLAALAQKRNRSFLGSQDKYDNEKAEESQSATEEVDERNWARIWHHKMVEQQQEMLRRWIEKDPYNAIFGWSNRLRRGIKFDKYSSGIRKELDDMISASENVNRLMTNMWTSSQESKAASAEVQKKPVEKPDSAVQSPPNSQDTNSSLGVQTKAHQVLNDPLREYDPISNRMVHKSDKAFSHYGQDLDTEVDIPVKPPKSKISVFSGSNNTGSPSVADVITELRQGKSHRLPDQRLQTSSQSIGFEKSVSQSISSEREKLEKSFAQLHANKSSSTPEELGTAAKRKSIGVDIPKAESTISTSQSEELKDLSERLGNLGSRLSHIRDTLGPRFRYAPSQATDNVPTPSNDSASVTNKIEPRTPEIIPLDPLENKEPTDELAKTIVTTDGRGFENSNCRRQLEVDRMQGEIADLDLALKNLGPGSLRFDLARQRKELARLTDEIKMQMEQPSPSRKPDQETQKLKLQSPTKNNVFTMIFGEKRTAAVNSKSKPNIGSKHLEAEIQRQKDAMAIAEDIKPQPKDQRLNDSELVKTIQEIYEERYGTIAVKDQTDKMVVEEQSVTQSQPVPNVEASTSTSKMDSLATPPPAFYSSGSTPQIASYTVLAYDPSTSEVSSTTLSAPISSSDTPLPITVALTQLGEPAKFLPHLRLLGNHGTAVSVTKNLLVLRTIVAPVKGETEVAKKVNFTSTATEENVSPSRDDAAEVKNTKNNPFGESGKGSAPQRVEHVFSGRARHERWDRSEEHGDRGWIRWMKRLGLVSGISVAVLYVGGVTAGLRRVNVPKESEEK